VINCTRQNAPNAHRARGDRLSVVHFAALRRAQSLTLCGLEVGLSDLGGIHFVYLGDDPASRNDLASRLETAGCAVDRSGTDWLKAGRFDSARPRH
jgi:hypothetical protein